MTTRIAATRDAIANAAERLAADAVALSREDRQWTSMVELDRSRAAADWSSRLFAIANEMRSAVVFADNAYHQNTSSAWAVQEKSE